jgi:hypothetical protein
LGSPSRLTVCAAETPGESTVRAGAAWGGLIRWACLSCDNLTPGLHSVPVGCRIAILSRQLIIILLVSPNAARPRSPGGLLRIAGRRLRQGDWQLKSSGKPDSIPAIREMQ